MTMVALDDDDPAVVVAMPAVIAMHAHFGMGAVVAIALDHHRLRAGKRRRRNGEGECGWGHRCGNGYCPQPQMPPLRQGQV